MAHHIFTFLFCFKTIILFICYNSPNDRNRFRGGFVYLYDSRGFGIKNEFMFQYGFQIFDNLQHLKMFKRYYIHFIVYCLYCYTSFIRL